jgi:hypothetical protein
MIWSVALLISVLIELQGLGGQRIYVNPDLVVNIRKPAGIDKGHFPPGLQCLVYTSDGKYFPTVEPCESVRKKLEGAGKTAFLQQAEISTMREPTGV